jgi:two-component system response regulator YesN
VEGEGRLALLCGYPAQRAADFDALQLLLENTLETPFMLGVGTAVNALAEASRSYAQALRAVRCLSTQGGRQAVYYQDLGIVEEPPLWAEPLQTVAAGLEQTGFDLQAGRNAEARAWLERLFGDPTENVESARLRAAWVIAGLSTLRATPGVDVRERIGQVFELPAPADVRELLLTMAGEATTTLDGIRTSAVSRQMQEILDYVRDHLAEPTLSLHETARLFFFNASYLSRIFKQNTGLAFRDYVNRQRIELARRYLDEPGAKAYEVGARVGIDDPNYFSTLFKKYAGMTVKQYRAGNENGG